MVQILKQLTPREIKRIYSQDGLCNTRREKSDQLELENSKQQKEVKHLMKNMKSQRKNVKKGNLLQTRKEELCKKKWNVAKS